MKYPQQYFNIDAMYEEDIKEIIDSFLGTGVIFIGMDNCYKEATSLMGGEDNSDLKGLFEDGVRLGIFLARNEGIIPHI